MGKEAVKRAEEEALHVVQGGHVEFTYTNFGKYVEEELVQQSFAAAAPLSVCEEWLRAMIFWFDAIVLLVYLEMEQVFSGCEHMLCTRVHSMLCSVQPLTKEQGKRGLPAPHLSKNRCHAVLLGGGPLKQHPIKLLVCI